MRYRREAEVSEQRLRQADGYFSGLELILIVAFFITIAAAGTAGRTLPWLPLWLLALIGLAPPLLYLARPARIQSVGGAATFAPALINTTVVSILVLVGVLALRAAVIFSAQ